MHRPYPSLTTSRFVVLLPSTYDNRLIKYVHINSMFKKGMFLKVKGEGGKFKRPVQGWGSTCRFGARGECGQRVRSINRIAPEGSHRYSRRGTTPLCYRCPLAIAQRLVHCSIAVSTAVLGQSHKDNVRCTAVDEQLEAKEVQLS